MLKVVKSYTISLHMAGDINTAKNFLRKECHPPNAGLCVTIKPETFIYAGGAEEGFEINFVNYPRFPQTPEEIYQRAESVAHKLIEVCCQWTALLVCPDNTVWISLRPENQR